MSPRCWRRRQIDPDCRLSVTQCDVDGIVAGCGMMSKKVGQSTVGTWVKIAPAPTRLGIKH